MNIAKQPSYFIIPFADYYNDVSLELDFFESFGIHPGVFFDEVIHIAYNNFGYIKTAHDFEDMDYLWVSNAFDTFAACGGIYEMADEPDYESFHAIYSAMVEKIFICIYLDIEIFLSTQQTIKPFMLEFVRFMGPDVIMKINAV